MRIERAARESTWLLRPRREDKALHFESEHQVLEPFLHLDTF
jgi:hypothetical protein